MTPQQWRTMIQRNVKDQASRLATEDYDEFLAEAVKRFSKDSPRSLSAEFSGDGAAYDFTLPSDWLDGVSAITEVEYPAGEREPTYMDNGDWALYTIPGDPSVTKFRMLFDTAQTGEKIRISYTAPHIVSATRDTISDEYARPVARLAASYALRAIAAFYAQETDPTLGADVTNHNSKSSEYTRLADKQESMYEKALGIASDGRTGASSVRAASGMTNLRPGFQWGEDRMQHPRRWR